MKKIMIFAPHPDDDVIGCGGSMAKHIQLGNEVTVVYMTSGESGSLKYEKESLAKIRREEAEQAGRVLGVNHLIFLNNPDGYLELNKENLVTLINLIRKERPDVIYFPHKADAHRDHQMTHELVKEAAGRAAGPWFQECEGASWPVPTQLCYEVWTPLQSVSYVEDVTEHMERKLKALEQHKSQIQDINYIDAVKGLNSYRSAMTGRGKYCECFTVIKTNSI